MEGRDRFAVVSERRYLYAEEYKMKLTCTPLSPLLHLALRAALAVAPPDPLDDPPFPLFFPNAADDEDVAVCEPAGDDDDERSRLDRQTSGPKRNFGLLLDGGSTGAESVPELSP